MSRRAVAAALALLGAALPLGGCIFPFDSPECEPAGEALPFVDDVDRDGFAPPDDCDDGAMAVHPGAVDVPGDGLDQDCDGDDAVIDPEAVACGLARPALFGENAGDTRGADASFTSRCDADGGPAVVLALAPRSPTAMVELRLRVVSDTPHVVQLRAVCDDAATELACASPDETLTSEVPPGGRLFAIVTAVGDPGPFVLEAEELPMAAP